MQVKAVVSKNIITIYEEATLLEAVRLFSDHQISGLLVVNKSKEMVGLLSEKDVYRAMYPDYHDFYTHPEAFLDFEAMESRANEIKHCPVKQIMIRNVYTVSENDPLMKVGAIMLARHINRLPVVDRHGSLIGIVSRRDIYQAIFQEEFKIHSTEEIREKSIVSVS
jgi:CBS domain-containing protein